MLANFLCIKIFLVLIHLKFLYLRFTAVLHKFQNISHQMPQKFQKLRVDVQIEKYYSK
jgi:hypothetical protein